MLNLKLTIQHYGRRTTGLACTLVSLLSKNVLATCVPNSAGLLDSSYRIPPLSYRVQNNHHFPHYERRNVVQRIYFCFDMSDFETMNLISDFMETHIVLISILDRRNSSEKSTWSGHKCFSCWSSSFCRSSGILLRLKYNARQTDFNCLKQKTPIYIYLNHEIKQPSIRVTHFKWGSSCDFFGANGASHSIANCSRKCNSCIL